MRNSRLIFIFILALFGVVITANISRTQNNISRTSRANVTSPTPAFKLINADITHNDLPQLSVGSIGKVEFTFKPQTKNTALGDINGLLLEFVTSGNIEIYGIAQPLSRNAFVKGTELDKFVSPTFATLTYDIDPVNGKYPDEVTVVVQVVKRVQNTTCDLRMNLTNSFLVYPTTATGGFGQYLWNQVDHATCSGTHMLTPSVSPPVTVAPTLPPTAPHSPTIPQTPTITIYQPPGVAGTPGADATCDGTIAAPTRVVPVGMVVVPETGLKFQWDPVQGADFYVVEIWRESKNKPTGVIGIVYEKVFSAPTYQNTFVLNQQAFQLVSGTQYLWKVSSIDRCGNQSQTVENLITIAGSQPTPSPRFPSATPTQAVPAVNIQMRLRFQAIYTQPQGRLQDIPTPYVFLVWVRNADRETPIYKWVNATYDGIGSWIINEQFNLIPSDGYRVWIKGERHLQRKICDGRPSDQESGWYKCANDNGNIVIHPGDNYFDFSNILLFAGDVPFKGEGDGVLDAFDLSYIATHFGDTESLIADMNFDGVVDSQDYVIAARAIQVQKYDETYPYKIHPFFRKVPLRPQFP